MEVEKHLILKKKKSNIGRNSYKSRLSKYWILKKTKVRGGSYKIRGLVINRGTFNWCSMSFHFSSSILSIVYNPSNDILLKKKILTKGSIVKIYSNDFSTSLKRLTKSRLSSHFSKYANRNIITFLRQGFLLAKVTSRPGQSGWIDGKILENKELELFLKKNKKIYRKLI